LSRIPKSDENICCFQISASNDRQSTGNGVIRRVRTRPLAMEAPVEEGGANAVPKSNDKRTPEPPVICTLVPPSPDGRNDVAEESAG